MMKEEIESKKDQELPSLKAVGKRRRDWKEN